MDRGEVLPHAGEPGRLLPQRVHLFFAAERQAASSGTFEEAMPTPGFLFVGASESLVSVTDRFMLEDVERAFVYVKR